MINDQESKSLRLLHQAHGAVMCNMSTMYSNTINIHNKKKRTQGWLDVYGWRFQSRLDNLPGRANNTPTVPWKIGGFTCCGCLGLGTPSYAGIQIVVQDEGVQCLKELVFLSIALL